MFNQFSAPHSKCVEGERFIEFGLAGRIVSEAAVYDGNNVALGSHNLESVAGWSGAKSKTVNGAMSLFEERLLGFLVIGQLFLLSSSGNHGIVLFV